jgi:catechol 2,3-dioxygenase-like lactoylglutathione lyase family enzyme
VDPDPLPAPIESISAITLVTADMAASVGFYRSLGFEQLYGGADASFTSLRAGPGFVNLQVDTAWTRPAVVWGRVILWVDDVDAMFERATAAGLEPLMRPSDAPWGERYFHLDDPAGHQLSFARPLGPPERRHRS